MSTKNPTWGYKPDGSAQVFDLFPGEGLPEGWEASPACISDPDLATAEALSARAEGRAYEMPVFDAVSGFRVPGAERSADADNLAAALAEIARLQSVIETGSAENAALVTEMEAAEATLAEAADRIAALNAALVQAQADGGFAAEERDAARADLDALKAELDQARADLDAATKPKAPTPAAKAGK